MGASPEPPAEFALIANHLAGLGAARDDVLLGIGDDAALLDCPDTTPRARAAAATLDSAQALRDGERVAALVAEVCQRLEGSAAPRWATLSLSLPTADAALLTPFASALDAALRARGIALIGGDTTRGPTRAVLMVLG